MNSSTLTTLFPPAVWTNVFDWTDDSTARALAATCRELRRCSKDRRAEQIRQKILQEPKGAADNRRSASRRRNRLLQIHLMVVAYARRVEAGHAKKKEKTILCVNSFERALAHNLASVCGVGHRAEIHYEAAPPHFHAVVAAATPCPCHSRCKKITYSATAQSLVVLSPTPEPHASRLIVGNPREFGLRYPTFEKSSVGGVQRPQTLYANHAQPGGSP